MDTSSNPTKPDKTRHALNPRQSQAMELLLTGMNDREVAAAVSVSRQTVCGWRHQPEFQAQIASPRRELWAPYIERLQSLASRAVESIEWEMLSSRDGKLALRLVELVGLADACRANLDLLPPPIHPPVSTSPEWKRNRAEHEEIAAAYVRSAFADAANTRQTS